MAQYRWKAEYPKEPEFVHDQVLRTLEMLEAQEGEKGQTRQQRRRKGHGRVRPARWAAVLAAAMLCGVTVYAAVHYRLPELLGDRFDAQKAAELIQTEPEVTQPETPHVSGAVRAEGMEDAVAARPKIPDTLPLLDIKETLFDGMRLYIYAVVTENGKNYDLNADRLYVNDREAGPVSTAHLYPGMEYANGTVEEECYTFEVALWSGNLGNLCSEKSFEVTLPLSVYERVENPEEALILDKNGQMPEEDQVPIRYQNQDLTFTVDVPEQVQTAGSRVFEKQTFTYDEFTLEISDIRLAADSLGAFFYYKMTPEQLASYQSGEERLGYPLLKNSNGEECAVISASLLEKEDGVRVEAEYSGISAEDDRFMIDTGLYNRFQERRSVGEISVELVEESDGKELAESRNADRFLEDVSGAALEQEVSGVVSAEDNALLQDKQENISENLAANEVHVTQTLECQNGTLEVNAAVDCPEDAAYKGTLKLVPFTEEIFGKLYGTPENWKENESQQEVSCIHWNYNEDKMFENSFISGSVGDRGQNMDFELELRSAEEYEAVRERMKIFTPEQAAEALGINADILSIPQVGEEDHQFYYIYGKVKNCKVMWDSPVRSMGNISLEYGDITAVQFEGNYEVADEEPAELLSIDEVLNRVQTYADAGQINRQMSGAAISEIELQYYLEEQEGKITFRPVWTFKVPEMIKDVPPSTEEGCEIFCVDAVNGELLVYKGVDAQ